MYDAFREHLVHQIGEIRDAGLYKDERIIQTPQQAHIAVPARPDVLNMCANNYLGLADDPRIVAAARQSLERWGYGMSSVRFICGTQQIHKQLEQRVSSFLHTDDTILYTSCFDANGGLFETLLSDQDAVISDQLNHASIIDGIRLCKARRYRYSNRDMSDLAAKLQEATDAGARFKLIASDGVFSMDGFLAPLPDICELADQFGALVMVDDSHATGCFGPGGGGTPAHHGVQDRVDILTSTLGKALGGASGGFTTGRREIIELLRQRSRPYLFSNTLAPPIVGASLKALELISQTEELRSKLARNTQRFRQGLLERGFEILPGEHPIVPIMFYDAQRAADFAERLLAKGIYVIAFSYPVVPPGEARIRVQLSAAHSEDDLTYAWEQFAAVRDEMRGA